MENKLIGKSLIETLSKSNFADIVSGLSEIPIDNVLDEGLLRDIPIVGALTNLYKFTITIRDRILLKKLYTFLNELDDISYNDRIKFINKLDENIKFQDKVGESLIIIIDRLDDVDKSKLLAKVFKGFILHKINYEEFRKLAIAIDRAAIDDLLNLSHYYENLNEIEVSIKQNLFVCQLVDLIFFGGGGFTQHTAYDRALLEYEKNKLGKLFIELTEKM